MWGVYLYVVCCQEGAGRAGSLLSLALARRSPVQTELEQNQPSPSEKVARGLETPVSPLSPPSFTQCEVVKCHFSLEVNGHVELILTLNERRATGSGTSEKLLCESRRVEC